MDLELKPLNGAFSTSTSSVWGTVCQTRERPVKSKHVVFVASEVSSCGKDILRAKQFGIEAR